MKLVIRIGGSVVASPFNPMLMNAYVDLLQNLKRQGHVVAAVVGGGSLSRELIKTARAMGLSETAQDEVAISISRVMAQLLVLRLGKSGSLTVPTTIEDAAELQLKQPHVARLETRPPNLEGTGAVRQRELLINSLRMRPDRIVVGEVRGEEALDMLQAMNTGHDGSLTTVHANSPRDAISRLEVMVSLANANMQLVSIRQQIASAVHVLVQASRLSDGSRRVVNVTEVTGMEGEVVTLQDIFVFEKRGLSPDGQVIGRFAATGIRPKFYEKLLAAGIRLRPDLFDEVVEV